MRKAGLNDDANDDDNGIALLDACDDDYKARPPFEFVGIGESNEERFIDAAGRSCSMLDVYRADFAVGSEGRGLMDDARRQIERGRVRQGLPVDGRWRWERP